MNVIKHDDQPLERWREGVATRMRTSALTGGRQLCTFEQFCDPGLGAPTHLHAVEEVLEVIEGTAEVWPMRGRWWARTNPCSCRRAFCTASGMPGRRCFMCARPWPRQFLKPLTDHRPSFRAGGFPASGSRVLANAGAPERQRRRWPEAPGLGRRWPFRTTPPHLRPGLFWSGAVEVGPVRWHGSAPAGGPIRNG